MACFRWHRLGEMCSGCGYLTVPARFYGDKKEPLPQAVAERAYEAWRNSGSSVWENVMLSEVSDGALKMSPPMSEMSPLSPPMSPPKCRACGKPWAGRGRVCWGCKKQRQRAT